VKCGDGGSYASSMKLQLESPGAYRSARISNVFSRRLAAYDEATKLVSVVTS
jgi:hypothetical protein